MRCSFLFRPFRLIHSIFISLRSFALTHRDRNLYETAGSKCCYLNWHRQIILIIHSIDSVPRYGWVLNKQSSLFVAVVVVVIVYEVLNRCTSERVASLAIVERKKKLCLIKMWNYCKINVIHATWSSLSHLSSGFCGTIISNLYISLPLQMPINSIWRWGFCIVFQKRKTMFKHIDVAHLSK